MFYPLNHGPAYGEKPEEYTGRPPINKHPDSLKVEDWLRIYLPVIKM